MYAAFGVASPFLPAFVHERGLAADELGLVLGAWCIALAACVTLGYLAAHGLWTFLAIQLLQSALLAPITILADALAVRQSFEYGWARGTGSAAFVAGTLASGELVAGLGLSTIVWMQSALLAAAAIAAGRVHELARPRLARPPDTGAAVGTLLRIPVFRRLVLVAALILGSHAMHDAFAVIRWSAAGIGPVTSSLLWSEAVAAEVLVFVVLGAPLLRLLSPFGALALAACAGMLRWGVAASTTTVAALALIQPLHGLTFALLHLACMRLIARNVPAGLEGTAQAIYGSVGIGAATAVLTVASGALFQRFGGHAFWGMAALCALALPLTAGLRGKAH